VYIAPEKACKPGSTLGAENAEISRGPPPEVLVLAPNAVCLAPPRGNRSDSRRGRGSVYQRGHSWWIRYRSLGRVVRQSAAKVLGAPVRTRAEALAVLRSVRGASLPVRGLGRPLLAARPDGALPGVLADVLPTPDFDIAGVDVQRAKQPIVYCWARDDRVLYIGRSIAGIARPFSAYHHRLRIEPTDRLLIWVFASEQEAVLSEGNLIARVCPEFNAAGKPAPSLLSIARGPADPPDSGGLRAQKLAQPDHRWGAR